MILKIFGLSLLIVSAPAIAEQDTHPLLNAGGDISAQQNPSRQTLSTAEVLGSIGGQKSVRWVNTGIGAPKDNVRLHSLSIGGNTQIDKGASPKEDKNLISSSAFFGKKIETGTEIALNPQLEIPPSLDNEIGSKTHTTSLIKPTVDESVKLKDRVREHSF